MIAPNGSALLYLERVLELLKETIRGQQGAIEEAARLIAASLARGGLLHVFGTGHSHMMAEELYGRAGGLIPVNAILIPSLMLHEDLMKATLAERREDLAPSILADQPFQRGDVLIVISNSGRNGLAIEVARLARQQGIAVIALTALEYSRSLPSRHSSGMHLFDVVDIVLDNHGQKGDACLEFSQLQIRAGPTSTILGAAVLNATVVEVIARLAEMGIKPPVLVSANVAGQDEQASLEAMAASGQRLPPMPLPGAMDNCGE